MNRVDLKEMVQRAVGGEWEGFCERHPALSRALDQQLMVEHYAQDLKATPDFLEAMRQVEMQGLAHGVLQEMVVKIVRGWMRVV